VLLTDLDGTLLDYDDYSPSSAAVAALDRLAGHGIITIPVTSKTASEVVELIAELDLAGIAVVEGGSVLLEPGGSTRLLGRSARELQELRGALQMEGWDLRGMSEMSPSEVQSVTGLDEAGARRALRRIGSEPFLPATMTDAEEEQLSARAVEMGARIVRGGRFWHLLGKDVGKRHALGMLRRLYPNLDGAASGAVGDAWNDLGMLAVVDRGFLLGSVVEDKHLPPGVDRISEVGPVGFTTAARRFLSHCLDSGCQSPPRPSGEVEDAR
jgi:mannosyl-3-phosphoglycerate phosphatase